MWGSTGILSCGLWDQWMVCQLLWGQSESEVGHNSLGGLPSAQCKGLATNTAGLLCWALLYQEGQAPVNRSSPVDGLLSPEKRDRDEDMREQVSSWARTLGQAFSSPFQQPP